MSGLLEMDFVILGLLTGWVAKIAAMTARIPLTLAVVRWVDDLYRNLHQANDIGSLNVHIVLKDDWKILRGLKKL